MRFFVLNSGMAQGFPLTPELLDPIILSVLRPGPSA